MSYYESMPCTKTSYSNVDVLNKVCGQFYCHLRVLRSIAGVLTSRLGLYMTAEWRAGGVRENSDHQTVVSRRHFNIFAWDFLHPNSESLSSEGQL